MRKISYLSGAADFKATYDQFAGIAPRSFFGTNYLGFFIEFVLEQKARAQVFTWRGDDEFCDAYDGRFEVLNRPLPLTRGLRFHIDMVIWNLRQLRSMLRFRPDVLVLTGSQDFWWVYSPLRLVGTTLLPSFHCVQWPIFQKPSWRKRFYARLNGLLVLRSAPAIVVTSQAIRRQVVEMLRGRLVPIHEHLPTYSRQQFEHLVDHRPIGCRPFGVLFVGRIEENKGVFDLVRIAAELERARASEFQFHFCGTGSALEALEDCVHREGLGHAVFIHGYCDPAKLSDIIALCHCYVVPTKSDFEAGYEMTCAEAVLAHRPLITSAVAPAIDTVRDAAIEVPPDDRDAYRDAIVQLADDATLYALKMEACRAVAELFYDPKNSWKSAMTKALVEIRA